MEQNNVLFFFFQNIKKISHRLFLLNSSISLLRAAKPELLRHSSQQARAWQSVITVP